MSEIVYIICPKNIPKSLKEILEKQKIDAHNYDGFTGSPMYLLAIKEGYVIASATFCYHRESNKVITILEVITLEVLYVHPEFRRKGCATKMIDILKGILVEKIRISQCSGKIILGVHQGNDAIRLYRKTGFTKIDEYKYHDFPHDKMEFSLLQENCSLIVPVHSEQLIVSEDNNILISLKELPLPEKQFVSEKHMHENSVKNYMTTCNSCGGKFSSNSEYDCSYCLMNNYYH